MDAAIAGLLLVTATLAGSPVMQPVDSHVGPATTFTLREGAARATIPAAAPRVAIRQPTKRAPRFSRLERAIAIGAGTTIGFYGGAMVGWKATDNPSKPNDDTSGLRGVIIGAPIGAAVGAVLGFVLTR